MTTTRRQRPEWADALDPYAQARWSRSALDIATEKGVMEAVDSLHGAKTILIVAHRLSTVARCDRLYRLQGGRALRPRSAV